MSFALTDMPDLDDHVLADELERLRPILDGRAQHPVAHRAYELRYGEIERELDARYGKIERELAIRNARSTLAADVAAVASSRWEAMFAAEFGGLEDIPAVRQLVADACARVAANGARALDEHMHRDRGTLGVLSEVVGALASVRDDTRTRMESWIIADEVLGQRAIDAIELGSRELARRGYAPGADVGACR
jgi:hypothetical protein